MAGMILDNQKLEGLSLDFLKLVTECKDTLTEAASIASKFDGENAVIDGIFEGFRITEEGFNDNIEDINSFNTLLSEYLPAFKAAFDKADINVTAKASTASEPIVRKTASDVPTF